MYMYVYVYVCLYVYVYMYVFVCVYVYMYVFVCVYVYMCMYVYVCLSPLAVHLKLSQHHQSAIPKYKIKSLKKKKGGTFYSSQCTLNSSD